MPIAPLLSRVSEGITSGVSRASRSSEIKIREYAIPPNGDLRNPTPTVFRRILQRRALLRLDATRANVITPHCICWQHSISPSCNWILPDSPFGGFLVIRDVLYANPAHPSYFVMGPPEYGYLRTDRYFIRMETSRPYGMIAFFPYQLLRKSVTYF